MRPLPFPLPTTLTIALGDCDNFLVDRATPEGFKDEDKLDKDQADLLSYLFEASEAMLSWFFYNFSEDLIKLVKSILDYYWSSDYFRNVKDVYFTLLIQKSDSLIYSSDNYLIGSF